MSSPLILPRSPEQSVCKQCGAPVDRHVGLIEYPAADGRTGKVIRKTRLGAFWACMVCEWCEEAGEATPTATEK